MYERPEFTLSDSLQIQTENLANWKLKLNTECYNALELVALASNKDVTDPYEIKRGQPLDTFVANWKPGRDPFSIYFC